MKNKYFIISVLFLFVEISMACDMCGCFMGITPYDNQSQISFLHRYRVFNGYINYQHHVNAFVPGAYKIMHGGTTADSLKTYSSKDFESYKSFELRMRYFLSKKIEFNAYLPLVNNKYKSDDEYGSYSGLGDPTFFMGFHIIRKVDTVNFQQRLIVGGGFKLPLGRNNFLLPDGDRLNTTLQCGSGSTDGFIYLNYITGFKSFGFNVNAVYKFNGENKYKERLSNSSTVLFNFFYRYNRSKFSFIPAISLYYEHSEGVFVNSIYAEGTEMNVLLGGPSLDFFYKNFGLNLTAHLKVAEHREAGSLMNAGRFVASLSYNFNQKKYLVR